VPNAGGVGKTEFFYQLRRLRLRCLTAKNVSIRHDGALAEEYVVSSTTFIVVEVCLSAKPQASPGGELGHMKFSSTHRKCIEYLMALVPLIAEN